MVNVCYLITQGFSARMVLHTALVPKLTERGVTAAVVTPNADEASMQALGDELGVSIYPALGDQRLASSLALNQIQRYVFEDVAGNPALRAKHLRDVAPDVRRWRRGLATAMMWLNRTSQRLPAIPNTLDRIQQRLLTKARVEEQLQQIRPDVVVATYPANFVEAAYLRAASSLGIRTASHLLSWDNITCKGRFPVVSQEFVSWGPVMSAELQEHYEVPPSRIYECGVPHFDAHVHQASPRLRDEVLTELGLDPQRPYFLFGMSSPYFAPREIDVVEWLAARVRSGDYGDAMQLVVRPHPQNVQGNMADASWLPRLEALRGERVAVDIPRLQKSQLLWNMKRDDLPRLSSLLSGCAVCLNSGSTFSIDGLLHDRPVIMTAFDADDELPWHLSARRVIEYPHLAKLIGFGGVKVVQSFASLDLALRRYLADPSADAEGRARTRAQECGPCDGRAASRVADAFVQMLGHAPRPAPTATQLRQAAS